MQKRTAFIGAVLSLIPFGQPLIIKTGVVLSTSGLILAGSEKIYAGDYSYYFNRAFEKGENGDYYGAIIDFTKAIEINPNGSNAYYNRAWNKDEIGDYYGAISDYTEAIKIDPNDTELYVNRSIEKEQIGDIAGACLDAKKAVSMGDKASDNKNWINDNCKFFKSYYK